MKHQSSSGVRSHSALAAARCRLAAACVVDALEPRRLFALTIGGDANGPLEVTIGNTGAMQVQYNDFPHGHFYPFLSDSPEVPGSAGIFLRKEGGAVVGLSEAVDGATSFSAGEQTTGLSGDALTIITHLADPNSSLSVDQVVSYQPGDLFFRVDNQIINGSTAGPVTVDFFAAADLFLADSDAGFSFFDNSNNVQQIGGVDETGGYRLMFQSLNDAAQPDFHQAGSFSAIYGAIGSNANFNNEVLPAAGAEADVSDNAIGFQWNDVTIPAGDFITLSYFVGFESVSSASVPVGEEKPQAFLHTAPDLREKEGVTTYRFEVDYLDDSAINRDTLGDGDVAVVGPGYFQAARIVLPIVENPNPNEERERLRVTYEVSAPEGADFTAGSYHVMLQPDQVSDIFGQRVEVVDSNGEPVEGGDLGTFEVGPATLAVTPNGDAAALAGNLFSGGGIAITDATLQAPDPFSGAQTTGTFTNPGGLYGLTSRQGIALSTGNVTEYSSGGSASRTGSAQGFGTSFNNNATNAQTQLLSDLYNFDTSYHDVSELNVTFDLQQGVSEIVFQIAYATDDIGGDPFGIFVNGQNFSTVGGENGFQINADPKPQMGAVSGTELDRVLAPSGNPVMTIVIPASALEATGNTLQLILADEGGNFGDTTVYVSAFAGAPPRSIVNVDDEFGDDGSITADFVTEAIEQIGDKILTAGYRNVGGVDRWVLRLMNENGSPDESFGGDGEVVTIVPGLGGRIFDVEVRESDGKIFVCGDYDGRIAIGVYNANGELDSSVDDDGIATNPQFTGGGHTAYSLALAGDGSIYAAGIARRADAKGGANAAVVKFTPTGAPDNTFDDDGIATEDMGGEDVAGNILLQDDGKVVIAGIAGQRVFVARFLPNGSLDAPGFTDDGRRFLTGTSRPRIDLLKSADFSVGLAIQDDGKILVAASAAGQPGVQVEGTDFGLLRLHPDGSRDGDSFGAGNPVVTTDFGGTDDADDIEVLPGGLILVTGTYATGNTISVAMALFNPDGTPHVNFGAGGKSFFAPTSAGVGSENGTQASVSFNLVRRVRAEQNNGRVTLVAPAGDGASAVRRLIIDTVAPTASMGTVPTLETPGGASQALAVTFTDDVAIDASDITADVLQVVRRSDGLQLATTVSLDATEDGPTRVATFSAAAPDGAWDEADNGIYDVTLLGNRVSDTSNNVIGQTALGAFTVDVPSDVPTATLLEPVGTPVDGAASFSFVVRYRDNAAILASTLGADDITVTGPGGPLTVASATPDVAGDGGVRLVTYVVEAPDGTWDSTDGGTYTIAMNASQVSDNSAPAKFVVAGTLGSFIFDNPIPIATFGPQKATFTDADGTIITFALKGGTGEAFAAGDAIDLRLTGTNALSKLTVKGKRGDGRIRIRNITADGGLKSLAAKTSDMTGDLTLAGGARTVTLGSMSGVTADVTRIDSLKLFGALNNSSIRATESFRKVTAGSATGSTIFAGVRSTLVDELPTLSNDFVNPGAAITNVKIKGVFADTHIAAPTLGKLSLGGVVTNNAASPFGVAARSIRSIAGAGIPRMKGLVDPTQSTAVGDFTVNVLTEGAQAGLPLFGLSRISELSQRQPL